MRVHARSFHDLFFSIVKPHPLGRVEESLSRSRNETIPRIKYRCMAPVA